MTEEERIALRKEADELESRQNKGITEEELRRLIHICGLLQPPLEDLCKQVSERRFMQMTELSKKSVEERLEFYHKHCKKD